MERWFGPAEIARRLGVSPKALRVYEREGLVTPPAHRLRLARLWARTGGAPAPGARTEAPWLAAQAHRRAPGRAARLARRGAGPAAAGAVHATRQRRTTDWRSSPPPAPALARDGALSTDALTQLTRETAVTDKMSDEEMAAVFIPLTEKHFSAEEREAIMTRKFALDQEQVTREWDAMFAEARALMAGGDPSTPEAMNLAKRWMLQVERFTGGDPQTNARSSAMWKEALDDPGVRPPLAVHAADDGLRRSGVPPRAGAGLTTLLQLAIRCGQRLVKLETWSSAPSLRPPSSALCRGPRVEQASSS